MIDSAAPMKKTPPRRQRHVDSISALWRSAAPDGLRVGFGFSAEDDDGAKVSRWIHDQLATFDENTTVEDVLDELRTIAERTNGGADIAERGGGTVLALYD